MVGVGDNGDGDDGGAVKCLILTCVSFSNCEIDGSTDGHL